MALLVRKKKPGPLKPTANPYPSRFQRWRHSLTLKFFLILILGGSLRFYSPFYTSLQQYLFEATSWAQGHFIHPFRDTHALLKDTYTFMYLKDEYDRLKHENEAIKWQLQALKPLQYENATLRANLKIGDFETYRHLTARVLSTPYDGLHYCLVVAAGEREGLEKDQAVIVPQGVVGRVEKVGKVVSRILVLNDVGSRIPVMTGISKQKAILAGDGNFMPTLVYITDTRKVQKGEPVVTSGLGGIFPPGLPVGVVDQVSNGKMSVRPYISFQDLEWVAILKMDSVYREDLETTLEGE